MREQSEKSSWDKTKLLLLVAMSSVLAITLLVPLLGFEFWFNNKYEEVVLFEFVVFSVVLSAQWRFMAMQILSAVLLLMLSLLVWGWHYSIPHFLGKTDQYLIPLGKYEVSYRADVDRQQKRHHYYALKEVFLGSLIKKELDEIEVSGPADKNAPPGPHCTLFFPKEKVRVDVCAKQILE
jgi:hypothetical protein